MLFVVELNLTCPTAEGGNIQTDYSRCSGNTVWMDEWYLKLQTKTSSMWNAATKPPKPPNTWAVTTESHDRVRLLLNTWTHLSHTKSCIQTNNDRCRNDRRRFTQSPTKLQPNDSTRTSFQNQHVRSSVSSTVAESFHSAVNNLTWHRRSNTSATLTETNVALRLQILSFLDTNVINKPCFLSGTRSSKRL